jgi:hypothetical protein
VFVLLLSVGMNIPGTESTFMPPDATTELPSGFEVASSCAAYALSFFGNPIVSVAIGMIALISLFLVWPQLASESSSPLHEHLQRFAWSDGDLAEAVAARNASARRSDVEEVRTRPPCITMCDCPVIVLYLS